MNTLITLMDQIKETEFPASMGILLRHAEKAQIEADRFGNEVPLSIQGREQCVLLRERLAAYETVVESSPVRRCEETARLLTSQGERNAILSAPLLGDPGFFIENTSLTERYFLTHTPFDIVGYLLDPSRLNPRGFCASTPVAVEYFIETLVAKLTSKIHLFVTHDIILSLVLGYLFPDLSLETAWPNYLEGLLFWKERDRLFFRYRDMEKETQWG